MHKIIRRRDISSALALVLTAVSVLSAPLTVYADTTGSGTETETGSATLAATPSDTEEADSGTQFEYVTETGSATPSGAEEATPSNAEEATPSEAGLAGLPPRDGDAAKITETGEGYGSVQAAVDAASEGQTVQMLEDCEENITVASDGSITLDLNGHVLSAPDGERIILNQGTLTVTDTETDTPHYFKYRRNGAWELDTSASEGIDVSAITPETADGTIVKISGGILYGGNAADNGGAVSMQKDRAAVTTIFTGGSIVGCQAKCGAAIYLNEGKLSLNGGCIYGCQAGESGGGVESFANAGTSCAVNFSAGSIQYCSAPIGGGIYNKEYSSLKLSGTAVIAHCTSSNIGGGVCTNGAFEMTAGSVQDCTANKGGGVFVNSQNTAVFTMTGGSVTGSNATARSGGVEVKGSLILGGTASVTGNTLGSGTDAAASNIYLNGTGKTMTVNEGFRGSAGVSTSVLPVTGSPVVIAGTNDADYSSRFTSDSTDYLVRYNAANCLELIKASYSISYVLNGGSWKAGCTTPSSYNSGTGVTLPAEGDVLRTGHSFGGWYDNAGFSGSPVTAIGKGETGSKTFYAKWEHVHGGWSYTADGAVLTAGCHNPDCSLTENRVSVTVKANNTTYDQNLYDGASVENTSAWEAAGLTVPEISYYDSNGTLLSEAPKNAGVYTAKIATGSTVASAEFTISPVSLTIPGTAAEEKTYDGTDRAVVTAGTLTGVLSGDTVTVSAEGTFDSKDAGLGKTVNVTYILTGADAGNYTLAGTTTVADIIRKSIAVKAADAQSGIGDPLAALTYTADALCAGDSFTGSLTTDADKDVTGSYDILQGTLDAGDNYTVTFTKGTYTVLEKESRPQNGSDFTSTTYVLPNTTANGTGTPELPASGTWTKNGDGSWSFGNDGIPQFTETWAYIAGSGSAGGDWYYFGADGKAKTGFQTIGGKTWYFRQVKDSRECALTTGWLLDENGSWYYLEKTEEKSPGEMHRGWMTDPDDGYRYYLDPATGRMLTGWATVDGKMHYFNENVPSASGWTQNAGGDWVYDRKNVTPLGAMLEIE